MYKSSNPENFFETDADQVKRSRRAAKSGNKYGDPIALKSKLLAAIVDQRAPGSRIFVAESAGAVRLVDVDSGQTSTVYRGPSAPVTCVAVGGPQDGTLFAGCWDRSVWSWDIESKSSGRRYHGHTDFVKAAVCVKIGGKPCLISGGADKKIIVWDVATGARLHTLQDSVVNMLAIQDLVIDPVSSSVDEVYLVSASSDPHVRRWRVQLDRWEQVVEGQPSEPGAEQRTVLAHETTVYKLVFDHGSDEVDLWTSSGDGTTKCLSRLKNFASEDSFQHGDHVRAVAVTDQWVVTAGRDEDVKFWDRSSGKLAFNLIGHYDEVTDLVLLQERGTQVVRICSVSIDGTVRTWPVQQRALETLATKQEEEATKGSDGAEATADPVSGGLTADEEAELAALMEDD